MCCYTCKCVSVCGEQERTSGGWWDMNIQPCLVPPLLSNAGPGSHRGEGLSMQSSRMAAWQPRYHHTLYTLTLIIRDKWTRKLSTNYYGFQFFLPF